MNPPLRVAIAGNPNVGKTSLFNALTGLRYHVGNYPGVTVEVRRGRVHARHGEGRALELVDLPGCYSLTPQSEDEAVAYRALAGIDGAAPDAVLVVLDATNLARNLYLLAQVRELGRPCAIALNMVDLAEEVGLLAERRSFAAALSAELGLPVVPTVAAAGEGLPEAVAVLRALDGAVDGEGVEAEAVAPIAGLAPDSALHELLGALVPVSGEARARWLATAAIADAAADGLGPAGPTEDERRALSTLPRARRLEAATELVGARYRAVDAQLTRVAAALERSAEGGTGRPSSAPDSGAAMARSERIDRVLTHRVAGPLVFVAVMALVFQSIFTWAEPFMGVIEAGIAWLSGATRTALGPGLFTDLLTEGVIAGVGNVVVFVPQIALLFLFVGLLEESGYMARAAFIIDRLMSRVGLNGKAFVPLLGGYACAVPAIMSTRTISRFRDRVVAILMIPYMSCSARLPIYALMIGALFQADRRVWGPFTVGGLVLLAMYALSTVSALVMGAIYKRTVLRSPTPPLVLELPPYRWPRARNTLLMVWDRTLAFLRDAGTVILAVTIVLWALLSFPRIDPEQLGADETPIERSVGGRVGKAMEPALRPMGQDWRMGVGILGSFAAREVFVTTLGLVYGIESDVDEDDAPLREKLQTATDPETGAPRNTPLSGLALMVFFVYACQCMSTLAVVRRETGGWRWPAFMFVSMTAIAYVMAVLTFQVGLVLGF